LRWRAAERGGDRAFDRDPGVARDAHDLLEAFERLLDRAIDVLLVVELGRRDEHADLIHPGRGGALGALGVRHQRRELGAARTIETGQHFGGIGELWHGARRDERGELDDR
jgi:hypothetical protein